MAEACDLRDNKAKLREVDNFFRWHERAASPNIVDLQKLFLRPWRTPQALYHRLSRLCHALDIVVPGDPSLRNLRNSQRSLHQAMHPHRRSPISGDCKKDEITTTVLSMRHQETDQPHLSGPV
jgi:hypothetical protein